MKAVIEIDDNTPQAKSFLEYARTLPFAKIRKDKAESKSAWETAIAEGAVSVDAFVGEVKRQLKECYDNA